MEHTGYITLTRQSGLMRELQLVANNIANAATTGFRQEGLVFSEFVQQMNDAPSVSMSYGNSNVFSNVQGGLSETGGMFDLALEGDGYFSVDTPTGTRLTRAGNFNVNVEGTLVTQDGFPVLDIGGAAITLPVGFRELRVSDHGVISADGQLVSQIGVSNPSQPTLLSRVSGAMFAFDGDIEAVENPKVLHGFLESSNVDPMSQIARLVEIQRSYEMGQSFLDSEDERIRDAIKALSR